MAPFVTTPVPRYQGESLGYMFHVAVADNPVGKQFYFVPQGTLLTVIADAEPATKWTAFGLGFFTPDYTGIDISTAALTALVSPQVIIPTSPGSQVYQGNRMGAVWHLPAADDLGRLLDRYVAVNGDFFIEAHDDPVTFWNVGNYVTGIIADAQMSPAALTQMLKSFTVVEL